MPEHNGHMDTSTPLQATPSQRSRRTRRSAAVGLALVLSTSVLGACGDDGSITLPEFTIASDQLDQLLNDAKAQAETIGADVQSLVDGLGSLPEDKRAQVEEAVTSAKTASIPRSRPTAAAPVRVRRRRVRRPGRELEARRAPHGGRQALGRRRGRHVLTAVSHPPGRGAVGAD